MKVGDSPKVVGSIQAAPAAAPTRESDLQDIHRFTSGFEAIAKTNPVYTQWVAHHVATLPGVDAAIGTTSVLTKVLGAYGTALRQAAETALRVQARFDAAKTRQERIELGPDGEAASRMVLAMQGAEKVVDEVVTSVTPQRPPSIH